MTFDLDTVRKKARGLIQDQDTSNPHVSDENLTIAARGALTKFALDRPADLIAEFAGDGGKYYDLDTVLTGWSTGFSFINWIEYPAASYSADETPNPLDPQEDWQLVEELSGSARNQQIYFPTLTPVATEKVRVSYVGVYTLSGLDGATSTSIPAIFEEPFSQLLACYALQQMAARMAQKGEPTFGADVTNHADLTGRLQSNARFWLEQYAQAVGVKLEGFGTSGAPAASGRVDWDLNESQEQGDFLFHGRRGR